MEEINSLQPAVILLVVGILAIATMRPLHLSPIVGYLLAGMFIGEHGFGLVHESHTTHLLAELGVVFLLFDIGLHFSLAHIWDARKDILGLGPIQVLLCTAIFAIPMYFLGFSMEVSAVIGATLALSSTAVASQIMADRQQNHCPIAVSATAVLIFQDICAIFLLILANSMSDSSVSLTSVIGMAAFKASIAFVAAIVIGRFLIKPLFRYIAKSNDDELFTATALLIVLATAMATGMLELSLTLGAFLAGMIISETPYRHVIQTEVKPFRGLLLGFFFITVGMSLDTRLIIDAWHYVLAAAIGIVTLKLIFIYLSARLLGTAPFNALQMGVLLAQGSEFAFVIFAMPAVINVLGTEMSSILITAVAASMALTPVMVIFMQKYVKWRVDRNWAEAQSGQQNETAEAAIIIVGMGDLGKRVADGLDAHGIAYRAIEVNHERFVHASSQGYTVGFGNATDLRLMDTINMAQAKTIVITFTDYDIAKELVPVVKERHPGLTLIIPVKNKKEKILFDDLGMKAVQLHSFPKGIDLAASVLAQHGITERKIHNWMQRLQSEELDMNPPSQLAPDTASHLNP
jgi:CPA2 family monovalent cation:H+ antiporter-2